jgi:hypothetical protein
MEIHEPADAEIEGKIDLFPSPVMDAQRIRGIIFGSMPRW